MKSIVARFEELKKNPLALKVDVEGEEVVANKVEAAIALAGVALRDSVTGQFRDLDDVFLELAKSWDNLDRNTQRYIATIAAGSRQQSRFIAMMDGYDRTLELVELAQDSEGQSAAQFLKTLDSLDSKLNKISNSLEAVYRKFVDSDFFGGLLDSLNNFLQGIGKMDAGQIASYLVLGLTIGNSIIRGITNAVRNAGPEINRRLQTALGGVGQAITDRLSKTKIGGFVNKHFGEQHRLEVINQKKNNKLQAVEQQKIKIDADITQAKAKVNEIQKDIDNLTNERAEIDVRLNTIAEEDNDRIRIAEIDNQTSNLQSNLAEAQQAYDNVVQTTELTRRQLNDQTEAIINDAQLQANNIKQTVGQSLTTVGGALVSSLALGITQAYNSEDPLEPILTSLSAFALQIIPQYIGMIGTALANGASTIGAAVTAAGGPIFWIIAAIGAAVIGLTTLIANAIANNKSDSQRLIEDIDKLKDKQKELQETSERSTAEAAVKKTETKKLDKLVDTYDELINKTNRTTDENEKLKTTIDDLTTNFPDLIGAYDEAGNAILKQRNTWNEIIEAQKESLRLSLEQAGNDKIELAQNQLDLAIKNKQLAELNTKEYFKTGVFSGSNIGLEYAFSSGGVGSYLSKKEGNTQSKQVQFLSHLLSSSNSDSDKINALLGGRGSEYSDLGIKDANITEENIENLVADLAKTTNIEEQRGKLEQFFKNLGANEDFIEEVVSQTGSNLMEFATSLQKLDTFFNENKKENADVNKYDVLLNETIYSIIEGYLEVFSDSSKDFSDNLKNITVQAIADSSKEINKVKNINIAGLKSGENIEDFKTIVSSNRVSDTTKESYKEIVGDISDFSKITEEQEKIIQDVITEYRNSVIEEVSRLTSTTLSQIKGYLSAEDFEIINAEDWGNYSVKTIQTIINKLKNVVPTDTFNELNKRLEEISNNIEASFSGAFKKVADNFGINLAQLLTDKGVTEGVAERINDIFSDISDKTKSAGIIKTLVSADTDLGNLDQVKQLASLFYEVDNNEQKAIDHAIELRNALSQNFNFNLDSNSFNSTLTQLGENTNKIKKEFTDLNSAIKEYNENGRISAETVLTLIENGQAQYLMYDEVTKAVKINTQEVEKAWHEKINEAKAEAIIAIEDKKRLLGSVQLEIELNKQKINELQKYTSGQHSITKAGYQDLIKLLKTHAINQENGQIQIDENSLSENQIYFKELFEDSEEAYKSLINLALEGGQAIRQALMDGLTGEVDVSKALGLITTKLTLEDPPQLSGLLDSNVEKYFDQMSESYNLTLDQKAAKELEDYYDKRNKDLTEYRDLLAQSVSEEEKSLKIYDDLVTNKSMSEFFEDTAKATKEANEELKKYISSLERFYNLNKEIEEADRKQSKAKKAFDKNPTEETAQTYIEATTEKGKLGMRQKKSGEEQEKLDRKNAREELSELFKEKGFKFDDKQLNKLWEEFNLGEGQVGQLDQRGFKDWMLRETKNGNITYDNAQDIEKLFQEWLGLIDSDIKMQIDGQESYEDSMIELEDFKEEIDKLKKALDPLVAIKAGIEASNKILELAKESLDEYYESGGKEGTNIAQYAHTVGSAMSYNDATIGKLENYKTSLTTNNADLMKYVTDLGNGIWTYDYSTVGQLTDQKTIEKVDELLKKLQELGETEEGLKKKNKELGKSFQEMLKQNRSQYSSMITRVSEALAKLDQKQIDDVKKKYAMIQEEDDKYLESLQKSIDKQRQLRDQAKSYDDLEEQEKRLALLERDTSGANAAEVAALKEQIKDARQNLVDTEQDNIVNNIAENNEERKRKMDEETTFLQNVMDERTYDMQYYIDKAYEIVDSAIAGDEGAYQRMIDVLEKTDEEFYRNTREGQQEWFETLEVSWTHAKDHALAVQTGLIDNLGKTSQQVHDNLTQFAQDDEKYANDASNALDTLKNKTDVINLTKCWDEMKSSCDKALDAIKLIEEEIAKGPFETEARIKWVEIPADGSGSNGSGGSGGTGDSGSKKAGYVLSDTAGRVVKISEDDKDFTELLKSGQFESKKVEDISQYEVGKLYTFGDSDNLSGWGETKEQELYNKKVAGKWYIANIEGEDTSNTFNSNDEAYKELQDNSKYTSWKYKIYKGEELYKQDWWKKKMGFKYAKGGLVDYTGPAWVDGTKSAPEAFLSAEDTRNIQTLTEILQSLITPTTSPSAANKQEVKAGDTHIEIHVEVGEIANDYDVEDMLDTIQSRISEASEGQVTIVK